MCARCRRLAGSVPGGEPGTVTGPSVVIGALVHVDPTLAEVKSRTRAGMGDVAVALASGCAGALAFTMGASTELVLRAVLLRNC